MAWTRKAYTTQGPDPTAVVEWTNGRVTITEFQAVYQVDDGAQRECTDCTNESLIDHLGEELHKALEHNFHNELELEVNEDDGYNADVDIYGGP